MNPIATISLPDDISAQEGLTARSISFILNDRYIDLRISAVYAETRLLGIVLMLRDVTDERMKIDFIERLSSEFRTPITPIKGYSDLLAMGAMGELSPS